MVFVCCFLASSVYWAILTQHLPDVYSDFRGDDANSPRNELGLRDNDYRDIYDDNRYEDVSESLREALFNCRW